MGAGWRRYGVALVAVAAALLLHLLFRRLPGAESPFLFFWPAVLAAAWYGGLGPGLLATSLGTAGAAYFLFAPRFSLGIARPIDQIRALLFFAVGVGITVLAERLHRAQHDVREQARQIQEQARAVREQREALEQQAAELQARADELATVLDAVPAGVWIAHDPQCRRITGNRLSYEWLRLPEGSNVSKSSPPGERPESFTSFREGVELPPEQLPMQMAATGTEVRDCEFQFVFADGRTQDMLGNAVPLRDAEGNVRGAVSAFIDITDRKRAAEALRRQAEALAEADRHKDEFLAMLAHELRNPLAPIRNAVELLRQKLLRNPYSVSDEPASSSDTEYALRNTLAIIDRQVKQQARLLDDLLDIARIARGKVILRPVRLDLVRLVCDTVEDHRHLLEAAGLALDLALPEMAVWVEGDPTRLSQVVGNLLQNAAKFTPSGGRVGVRCAVVQAFGRSGVQAFGTDGDGSASDPVGPERLNAQDHRFAAVPPERLDTAVLTVADTGVGIEPALLLRIFDSFVQADRSLRRSRGGLGLGLALVKALVERHGGTVWAHSDGLGQGAEFNVMLPAVAAPEEAAQLPAFSPPASGPLRILIVEDHPDAAESLRDLLELAGCTVEIVVSGLEAAAAARRFSPEVVLCDLGLPGMDGYQVAQALRQEPSLAHTRLVAISGYGQPEDQERSLAAGFDLHLTKPIDFAELRRLLEVTPQPQQD